MRIQPLSTKDGAANYIPFAKNKLLQLEKLRRQLGRPWLSKTFVVDRFTIKVCAMGVGSFIRIFGDDSSGFIFHPRTRNGKGWNPQGEELTDGPFTYPLVDDDHGSRVLTWDGESWVASSDLENYGNLDWKGPDGEVLSWRGPASRSFRMDSLQKYDGFTSWDYTVMSGGLEVEHYTPYLNKVYQGGEVLYEFLEGCKVLGCALASGELVAVVSGDYTGRENPDGSIGGFYDEVYVGDTRIGHKSGSRPYTPWFFSASGLQAVHENQVITISDDLKGVAFDTVEAGSGFQTNKYNGTNNWGVEISGSWVVCRDFLNNEMQNVVLTSDLTEETVVSASSSETVDDLSIYYSGTDDPTVTVTGPDGYAGEGEYDYTVEGNHCGIDSVEWSYPTGCGMGTVSVVVTFKGGNTASGSKQVRMPSGMWVTDGYEYGPDYSTSNSGINTVVVLGEYEYTHYKGADINITTTHFTTDFPTSSEPSCPGCRSVTNGGTDYSRGTGEDYTYGGTIHYDGSTSCCPGARQGTDYDAYYKLYCISRRKWVCP